MNLQGLSRQGMLCERDGLPIVSIGVTLFFVTVAPVFSQAEPSSWTNHVVNGSFESPVLASGANHVVPASELAPWQTTEGAFLIWASALPNESAADGKQHLEVVSVWQTVPVFPGVDYHFGFSHSPRPGVDSTLTVSINGFPIRTFAENGSASTGFNWKRYGTNFIAPFGSPLNSMTIRFDGVGVAGNAHIDGVVLERLPLNSTIRASEVEVCWPTVRGRSYRVQFRSTLTTNEWTDFLGPIQGNGSTNCIKDTVPVDSPRRFYRVVPVEEP